MSGTKSVPLEHLRTRLAILWLSGSGVICAILVAQSFANRFGEDVRDVFGWAMPNLLPTLSLILTVLGAEALKPSTESAVVRPLFGSIAYWLSAAYLGSILFTILIEPLTEFMPLELLKLSSIWLGPLQGLVVSALSVLFFSEQARSSAPASLPETAKKT